MFDIFSQLVNLRVAGLGLGIILVVIFWIYRILMAFSRETRNEYITRLNEAVLELEKEKNMNIRLQLKIQTMEFLHSIKESSRKK